MGTTKAILIDVMGYLVCDKQRGHSREQMANWFYSQD
jgi:hypothetical protein